jgi:hypothetical protein
MICAVESTKVEAVSQFLLARPAASFIRNVGLPLDFHPVRADLKGIGYVLLQLQHWGLPQGYSPPISA